jgi:3alpha(or 20beta)-hydroxysteroid dehydrogenase
MRHMVAPGEPERDDDPSAWPLPPLGRVGEAGDVAEAAVFLASARASFINGVALLVDGGMRAGMRTETPPDMPTSG